MAKRQARRAVLSVREERGDRLHKVWVSNTVDGFDARLVSVRRGDGTFRAAVVTHGPSGERCSVKDWGRDEAGLVAFAEEFVREIGDERLKFRLVDLSGLPDLPSQVARLRGLGLRTD